MTQRTPATERYQNDVAFRNLTDTLYAAIDRAEFSPTEIREAAMLAHILYEERRVRPIIVDGIHNRVDPSLWYRPMTLPRLLATLQRRISRAHTTGGLTVVAAQLGVSKQTLENIVKGRHTPTPETQAALVRALRLTPVKRSK